MFNLKKAVEVQERLSMRICTGGKPAAIRRVGGADCGYDLSGKRVVAVIVVMSWPELGMIEVSSAARPLAVPYIPGFLNFREGPSILAAFRKLHFEPDICIVDGNGIAHPRKMGLASYVGVVLDICTIGCAKNPFYPCSSPKRERGAATLFENERNERVGFCLRSRTGVKPVFVSPGHKISHVAAKEVVLACSTYRIPEPLRQAHLMAGKLISLDHP